MLAFETIPCLKEAKAIAQLLSSCKCDKLAWISFSCKDERSTCHGESFAEVGDHTHTHTYSHTHACIHTHTHTHACIHTQSCHLAPIHAGCVIAASGLFSLFCVLFAEESRTL